MNDDFIVPLAIFLVIGIVVAVSTYLSNKNRILRELKKSPSKPINTVKDKEYVRLHGTVEAINDPLIAPLSKRPCVYYHIIVERKGDKSWHTVINDFKYSPFYLVSGGEKAKIRAHDKSALLFHLVVDHNKRSGWSTNPSQAMTQYLKSQNYDGQTWLFKSNKTLRYKEAILQIGEDVVVKGNAEWKRLEEPIEGFNFSRLLELTGNYRQRLIVTDLPKALKTLPKRR
ncbi:hypothetical protein [Gilvibacter sediminis]|uniref:hypothetical protein n=1 Tax=Gilvibacter sediminis TaxID=379071 RepID=UPI00234FE3A3|nr:hypothetical protein [Gilvibacter sediminis]MDC7996623.1 hypothetical protein [Gilvibacter sediminis]